MVRQSKYKLNTDFEFCLFRAKKFISLDCEQRKWSRTAKNFWNSIQLMILQNSVCIGPVGHAMTCPFERQEMWMMIFSQWWWTNNRHVFAPGHLEVSTFVVVNEGFVKTATRTTADQYYIEDDSLSLIKLFWHQGQVAGRHVWQLMNSELRRCQQRNRVSSLPELAPDQYREGSMRRRNLPQDGLLVTHRLRWAPEVFGKGEMNLCLCWKLLIAGQRVPYMQVAHSYCWCKWWSYNWYYLLKIEKFSYRFSTRIILLFNKEYLGQRRSSKRKCFIIVMMSCLISSKGTCFSSWWRNRSAFVVVKCIFDKRFVMISLPYMQMQADVDAGSEKTVRWVIVFLSECHSL